MRRLRSAWRAAVRMTLRENAYDFLNESLRSVLGGDNGASAGGRETAHLRSVGRRSRPAARAPQKAAHATYRASPLRAPAPASPSLR
jgi:hypothetical protein